MKKTLAVLALTLLSPLNSFGAETCSAEFVGSCKTFDSLPVNMSGAKSLRLPVMLDHTVIFNTLAAVKAEKNPPPLNDSTERDERAMQLAKLAVAAAKATIIGGTAEANLTSEQKAMLSRLDLVTIKLLKSSDKECRASKKFVNNDPTASYSDHNHQLEICPSAANLAPAMLLNILAHELGHAISPCVMAQDLYQVESTDFGKCLKDKDERNYAKDFFDLTGLKMVPKSAALEKEESAVLAKLEKCKMIKNLSGSNFNSGGTLYSKLSTCLDTRYTKSWKSYLTKQKDLTKSDTAPGGHESLRCYALYDEHFADSFGARVFARILQNDANASEKARTAMVLYASSICASKGEPPDPEHPPDSERIMIQMSPAGIQKALGCVMPKTDICGTDDFFTYPRAAARASEEAPADRGSSAN